MTEQAPDVGRPPIGNALQGLGIERLVVPAPTAHPSESVERVRTEMLGRRHGSVSHVMLKDDERFVGLVRDVDLIAAAGASSMADIAISDIPRVHRSASRDQAVWAALSRGESEVVVVDDAGHALGIIPASTLLAVLAREHDDDMARIAGYLHQGESARAVTEENVWRRFLHRLPWLVLGLAGAVGAAQIVAGYESALESDVVLAFFIPGIVYLADAVGTQTEAVVIRGLSLGIPVRRIALREILTGGALGLTLGLIFYPVAIVLWHRVDLALAVALSLAAACATANLVAVAIPWLIQLLGKDPAFGSGPLATVIQDIVSILIYFVVVTAIVVHS